MPGGSKYGLANLVESTRQTQPRPKGALHAREGQWPKGLYDLYLELHGEPRAVKPDEVIAPYYGDAYQKEKAAAARHLARKMPFKQHQSISDPKVTFNSSMRKNVPSVFNVGGGFNKDYARRLRRPVEVTYDDFLSVPSVPVQGVSKAYYMPDVNKASVPSPGVVRKSPQENGVGELTPSKSFMSILEHELGHSLNDTLQIPLYGNSQHLANPSELVNGLGRLQRENFNLHGYRFDADSMQKFFDAELAKPPEQQFQGFSNEGMRVIKVLKDSLQRKGVPRTLFKNAQRIIPALVQEKPQNPFYG